jgi:LysM repeat protein
MKTPRYVVLLRMTVILLLLTAVLAPAASAAPSAGSGCAVVYHRVARGEILSRIAARYGVSMWQVQQWNGIHNIDRIYAGSVLVIYPAHCARPAPKPAPKPWPAPKPAPAPWPAPPPGPVVVWPGGHGWPGGCCGPTGPSVLIASPQQGAHVTGMLTVTGSAADDDFAYYKLEIGAGSNPNTWSWFAGGESQVSYGTLGVLNTGTLACGTYTIRLVVVDNTGNFATPSQVTIVVYR